MKKNKLSKEAQELDKRINELAKTTTRRPKQVKSGGTYQFHNFEIEKPIETARKEDYQRWVLINKQGHLVGRLEHDAYNTRQSAKDWFQRTSSLSGSTARIEDLYYVLKIQEYEFLKELDVLDLINDEDIN
jgi:hypothetical protein